MNRPSDRSSWPTCRLGLAVLLVVAGCQGAALDQPRWAPQGWQRLYPSFAAPVFDLLRDPGSSQVVYAACGWQPESRTRLIGGVLRSGDRGRRWVSAGAGLPAGTEVRSLAAALPGPGADQPLLLAGTRKAGIYFSSDGASSWQPLGKAERSVPWNRLTVQDLVVLPVRRGGPGVIVAGTDGYGVLVSEDGGAAWEARNEGLRDLNVEALVSDSMGRLVAGTRYGGVYRSADLGRNWSSIDPGYEQKALSSMAMNDDGTLWIGWQNGGLAAGPAYLEEELAPDSFAPQGSPRLDRTSILALALARGEVVAGTMGEGVVFGRREGRFAVVQDGLENKSVTAVLIAPEQPGEVILGTWAGLYRGLAPRATVWPRALAVVLAALAVTAGTLAWRRSDWMVALVAFREMGKIPLFNEGTNFINHVGIELPLERRRYVLERLAWFIERADHDLRYVLADGIRALARTLGLVDVKDGRARVSDRQELAEAMAGVARTAEAVTARAESLGIDSRAVGAVQFSEQTRLFAALLSAESPGHLAALRPQLRKVARNLTQAPSASALDPDLVEELRVILGALEQLSRLPGAEDRALFLGQALTKSLQAQQRLAQRYLSRPSHSSTFALAVLESLRQLLGTAMQDVHQRAELRMELRSKVLTTRREAVVVLEIENVGQGHAHNVTVELRDDAGTLRVLQPRQDVKSLLRRQSARLEFLVEPRVSDRLRLNFRITYGDLERQDHVLEFADVAEFRQLSPRTFSPLYPNPYVVGRPLAEADVFIGREDTFELVTANLQGAHQDNVVILIGQRRMGKTSILRRLPGYLGDGYLPVLIDLQGLLGAGEASFFRDLTALVHDELAASGIRVDEPPAADFELDPAAVFKRRFLRDAERALGEKRLLLMFDEFEVLEERISSGDLTPRVLSYLRSLMQHEVGVSFMFAGTHRLDELTRDYWSVLFNLAVYLDVGHLSQSQVVGLFTRPTRNTFEVDSLALDKIYRTTGGHPHFSQLLARELVELCNREKLSYVTVQDVNVVTETVVDKGQLHIAYLWNEASRSERSAAAGPEGAHRARRPGLDSLGPPLPH